MDVELLEKLLRYDDESGLLFWKERPDSMFTNATKAKAWNAKHANKPAGYSAQMVNGKHYIVINVNRTRLRAHRIIAAMFLELRDEMDVDHLNGDSIDNRLANLRVVDRATNNRNIRRQKRNSSGVTGVGSRNCGCTYYAFIIRDREREWLGSFDNIFDAAAARKSAENRYDFGPSHGSPM